MPPYFSGTKSFELSKSTHLEPERGVSLFSFHPPLFHDPIFLLCCLGGEKGIFILVSLLEVKVPWDVESEEMLPCSPLLPPGFSTPSQQLLWDREQHISSSMRNGRVLHSWGGAEFSDHTARRGLQARNPTYDAYASMRASTCAAADDFTHTHTLRYCSILTVYSFTTWCCDVLAIVRM